MKDVSRKRKPTRTSGACILCASPQIAKGRQRAILGMAKSIRGYTTDVTCGKPRCAAPAHVILRPHRSKLKHGKYTDLLNLLSALPVSATVILPHLRLDHAAQVAIRSGLSGRSIAGVAAYSARIAIKRHPGGGTEITRIQSRVP